MTHQTIKRAAVRRAAAWMVAAGAMAGAATPAHAAVIFSEYVEGTSNNKAVEIYNNGPTDVNLTADQYKIQIAANGGTTFSSTINLAGTLAAGAVYVVAHSSASAAVTSRANQTTGSLNFNGNDFVQLVANTTLLDTIGRLGEDPVTEWGSGLTSTADNTLRRKETVLVGDVNATDAFNPATEWDGFPTDTFDGLGPVPEPAGLALAGCAAGATLTGRRRQRR